MKMRMILLCFVLVAMSTMTVNGVGSENLDKEIRESFAKGINATAIPPGAKEGSIADMLDRVLEKEFSDKEQSQGADVSNFNSTVADQQAVLETVARVTHDKPKKNDTQEENGTRSFQFQDVFNLDNENGADDMPTLIDRKDNVFVMSNPKSKYPVLQLDVRFISDLVVVIVSAAIGGIAFACLGQPVITGYLLAGSIIGPGGLSFVSEMVQVETVAQFGVVFLLFALGLEFSATKIRVVGSVALLGGLLQIFLFMCLCGITALICGAKPSEGVFVGAFLSMSSTAVVLKFLMDRNSVNTLHGQVTVGTLILQDCAVGLLFALLPVLVGTGGLLQGIMSMMKSLVVLSIFLIAASILSWSFVPGFLRLMVRLSSQTNELYQLASVAFCLLVAWCSDKLGLSLELGSFAAGVMISTTEFAHHTLEQVEPIRNLFAALFLSSIGMLIHVQFLWNHIDVLLASVILVIIAKTVVVTVVVKGFQYSIRTSFLVGISLAQIGEFAFVLLSRASNLHLVEVRIFCHVHHDELEPLFHVSSKFREAVSVARQMHFDYTTPVRVQASRKRENSLIPEEISENHSSFEGLESLCSSSRRPATPNAPKQVGKFQKSRISFDDMENIATLLFPPDTPGKDCKTRFVNKNHSLRSGPSPNRALFIEHELFL